MVVAIVGTFPCIVGSGFKPLLGPGFGLRDFGLARTPLHADYVDA